MMQPQQQSLKEIDFNYYIGHYARLFWKWKWYIITIGPIIGVIAFLTILKLGLLTYPPLPATVIFGLNTTNLRAYSDFNDNNLNRERLIRNRAFIEQVVSKLSLQLIIDKHARYNIFDSISVDSNSLMGNFFFTLNKDNKSNFTLTYTNKNSQMKNIVLESGSISSLRQVNMNGVQLTFSKAFIQEPFSFTFKIIRMRYAVDRILGKLRVTSPNLREGINYFSATYEGTDYPLVSQTLNTIADMFVDKNTGLQRKRMSETIKELEKQLAAADVQLSKSKSELKNYLASNPSAGLSEATQSTMTELIDLETGTSQVTMLIDEVESLKQRWESASKEDKFLIAHEMIVFLQTHNSLAAPALQASLTQYTAEKETAMQNYAKSHQIFSDIDTKFSILYTRIIQAIDIFISEKKRIQRDRKSSIQKITSRLHTIPNQELHLAELQRNQEIDAGIYSTILEKYNEAKVAETVDDGNIYIMEYALQPIAPSRLIQFAKSLGIIIAAMILFSFGPAVALDLIDKTVRSEQAVVKLLSYRFLETIPLVKFKKNKQPATNSKEKSSEKSSMNQYRLKEILITDPSIEPPIILEKFRSLVTKIQLDFHNNADKSLVVTSFEMDEGKSTIATNLAISFAEQGIKTILIDCDLRRGVTHRFLSINKTPGLSEYLTSHESHQSTAENRLVSPSIIKTAIPNLWTMPAGTLIDNPQKLLHSPVLKQLKDDLLKQSFMIIFDSPPVAVAADCAILSNVSSRYLLVIRAGRTNVVTLKKIIVKDYPMINEKVLGVVLNMGDNDVPSRYYSYYQNLPRKQAFVVDDSNKG
jgi:capsular exopolysaccharide synthesis family protein